MGRTAIFSASMGRAHPFDLDIWTMVLRTGRLRNLTDTPEECDEHAQLSPDGRTIVWMTNRGYPVPVRDFSRYGATLRTDYWLMDADGSRQRRLRERGGAGADGGEAGPGARGGVLSEPAYLRPGPSYRFGPFSRCRKASGGRSRSGGCREKVQSSGTCCGG